MNRIAIVGDDCFAAELARRALERGVAVVSLVSNAALRTEFALLGHEVHALDEAVRTLCACEAVVLAGAASNWRPELGHVGQVLRVLLGPNPLPHPKDAAKSVLIGTLLDPFHPPAREAVALWRVGQRFVDLDDAANALAQLLADNTWDALPDCAVLPAWEFSAEDALLGSGASRSALHAWWQRHGTGMVRRMHPVHGGPLCVWEFAPQQPGPPRGTVVFSPGYKGYSMWGAWRQLGAAWSQAGWRCFLVDFSKNGTTSVWPNALRDEASWSQNVYSAELEELIAFVGSLPTVGPLVLMGHSRGALATLAAARSAEAAGRRLRAVVLLAPVAYVRRRFPAGGDFDAWQASDRWEVVNARTGQVLVHPFSFYTDFVGNEARIDPLTNAAELVCPVHVFHATDDAAVAPDEGRAIAAVAQRGHWHPLVSGGHTLGTREPWDLPDLSPELAEVFTASLQCCGTDSADLTT